MFRVFSRIGLLKEYIRKGVYLFRSAWNVMAPEIHDKITKTIKTKIDIKPELLHTLW